MSEPIRRVFEQVIGARAPLLAIAYLLSACSNLLLSVVVGRKLGAAALGTFALGIATSRLFFALTDFGLGVHLVRLVAREREAAHRYLSLFATFRICLLPGGALVSTLVVRDGRVLEIAPLAFAIGITNVQVLFESVLLGHEKQINAAIVSVISSLFVATACAAWYFAGESLSQFAIVYAAASLAAMFFCVQWVSRRLGVHAHLHFDRRALAAQIRDSWPIGASSVLAVAALRCPLLVIGWSSPATHTGAFAVVDTFVTAAAVVQSAVTASVFPKLAASYRKEPERFQSLFWSSNAVLFAIGLLSAGLLATLGPAIAAQIFPSRDFALVAELMPVVAFSAPALLLIHHNIFLFAAADHQRANIVVMGAWFLLIALGQVHVPVTGVLGASVGLLLSRALGLLILALVIFKLKIHRGEPGDSVTSTPL